MNENNFYKCTIKTETEDSKGRVKYKKENYIVEAVSPTDVEVKMAKHLDMSDYEVTSISIVNILEIIK